MAPSPKAGEDSGSHSIDKPNLDITYTDHVDTDFLGEPDITVVFGVPRLSLKSRWGGVTSSVGGSEPLGRVSYRLDRL